jgi:hypothetical protein
MAARRWTIGDEQDEPATATPECRRMPIRSIGERRARRARARGLKPERGAGSAGAERSAAALI